MPKGTEKPADHPVAGAPRQVPSATSAPSLPPGWAWTTIGEVAEVNPRDSLLREISDETEVTFVPMAAVDALRGVITQPQIRRISEVRKGYTPFREGDVLFAKITPSMENGKAAIARQLRNGVGFGSTEFHVLRPRPNVVLSDWLFYYIRQEGFRREAKANFTGTAGQLRVPARFLVEYPLPLAPLAEQRRIVARIEELFSQLDAAEEGLRRVQRNLKRYRAAVLKAAVEGRLVPTEAELARAEGRPYETGAALLQRILAERRRKWEEQEWAKLVEKAKKKAAQARRKAHGLPARIKDIPPDEWQSIPEAEYRRYLPKDDRWKQKYKEPTPPDTTNLPPLPEGWVWATVEMVAETASGGTPYRKDPSNFGGNIPWVKSGELRDSLVKETEETITEKGLHSSSARIFPRGAILIALYGATVGRLGILDINAATNQAVCALIPYGEFLAKWFLFYYLMSQRSRLINRRFGGAQPNISQEIVRTYPVPLPPLAEQRRIVAEVERRLSVAREAEKAVEANLKRIARLRQAILKRAFEGKLVPQDPSDEPATVLMERIRRMSNAVR